jgi:alpha-L-fucosidase
MKYAILVCKHHDGFANWPTKYSEYHVGLTPWRGGKGDVVAEFVAACRKYDIKVGLYYSPAEAKTIAERDAVITPNYDDYFIAQISELLDGSYGKIDYLWFDGCGSEGHEYDKPRIIKAIRSLQPEILVFNMWDPDTRWVGNEGGAAGVDNTNLVDAVDFSVMTSVKESLGETKFMPSECDFMMRRRNWFYSEYDVHTVKTVEELVGLYYYSVGCGSNFLVNIGPDRRGLLPDVDSKRLVEFGSEIKKRFSDPIPANAVEFAGGIGLKLEKEQLINHIIFAEDLSNGEMVEEFAVYIKNGIIYNPVCVYTGKTVGNKRIILFPQIPATEVFVKVTKSRGEVRLLNPQVFYIT